MKTWKSEIWPCRVSVLSGSINVSPGLGNRLWRIPGMFSLRITPSLNYCLLTEQQPAPHPLTLKKRKNAWVTSLGHERVLLFNGKSVKCALSKLTWEVSQWIWANHLHFELLDYGALHKIYFSFIKYKYIYLL